MPSLTSKNIFHFVFCIGVCLTIFNIYQLHMMSCQHEADDHQTGCNNRSMEDNSSDNRSHNSPVVWIHGNKGGGLNEVISVFKKLGFVITSGETDWDVLWDFSFPFMGNMLEHMKQLKPHQKVNHFPGSGHLTNKIALSTDVLSYPVTFQLPQDKQKLLQYAQEHPNIKWVRKNVHHRGIKVVNLTKLNGEKEGSYVVQQFIDNPLLIDERKFDIGIYVILTSLSPLRVYRVFDEIAIRFCPNKYHPFDPLDIDKYVIADNYAAISQIPSLKDLYVNRTFSIKETFNRIMINQGKDIDKMWSDIHDIIREVFVTKQSNMMTDGSQYNSLRNFFELYRFDFILDDKMKVYLMEANFSPNLSPGHFKDNTFYQHVIYNVLRISRVASMVQNHFHNSDVETNNMISSDRDVMVFSDWCHECIQCSTLKCMLCKQCITSQQMIEIKDAYLEHYNRGGCKRIFPPELNQTTALEWTPETDVYDLSEYSDSNRLIYMWFIGMCRRDVTFCS